MSDPGPDEYVVELLAAGHDRGSFSCGVAALDRYLAVQATQDLRRGYATVFVTMEASTGALVGFYTLSMSSITVELLPEAMRKKLPRYPLVPAVRLGRLAVSTAARGRGLGRNQLLDAMRRALESDIAWAMFAVDAKDDVARSFYRQFGFLELADDALHLFLPRETVARVVGRV